MSQPTPPERLARLLPPDGCRELVARVGEMRAAGLAGTVARLEVTPEGKLRLVLMDERHYEWGHQGA